jgi:predicted acylesterase/phospholipase RssA
MTLEAEDIPLPDTPVRSKADKKDGPHRLLALDGGGIRGVLSLEILSEMEKFLADQLSQKGKLSLGKPFVLADYFDYIAGTSTGGIIATGLALGMSVSELQQLYSENGREMFQKIPLLEKINNLAMYRDGPLAETLKKYFGETRLLGDHEFKTLLMLAMRNASTDSPWLVSNNPYAKYNHLSRIDCNLNLPVWQLVRASTAAPAYFPPEVVQIGSRTFKFVDGGMTSYNSPSFQLFLMATSGPYNLNWATGEKNLLLVSIGTGLTPNIEQEEEQPKNLIERAKQKLNSAAQIGMGMPLGLMYAAQYEQDLLCRLFGKCKVGDLLDREVGTLIGGEARGPLDEKVFTYLRYDVELTRQGLDALQREISIASAETPNLEAINPKDVQGLDSVDSMDALRTIGRAVARRIQASHFEDFL